MEASVDGWDPGSAWGGGRGGSAWQPSMLRSCMGPMAEPCTNSVVDAYNNVLRNSIDIAQIIFMSKYR
jgi:hypothetical protein